MKDAQQRPGAGGREGGSPRNIPQQPNAEKPSQQEGSFRNAKGNDTKEAFNEDYEVKKEDEISKEEAATEPGKD